VPVLVIKEARVRPVETSDEFERLVSEAVHAPFSGWDFSWLEGRRIEIPDPRGDIDMDYEGRARERIASAHAVLDLGTGGGEVLSRLAPFPKVAVATEAYPPNVTEAARRLTPLGVQVIWTDPACADSRGPQLHNQWPRRRLPFADATFDLVLARSSSFCPREVFRILKPGGTLLTVQAGTQKDGLDKGGPGLVELLEGTPPGWIQPGYGWDIDVTLDEAGFVTVEEIERRVTTTYRDIGAVVYFLVAVPWVIIDFEVNRYRQRLYQLHQRMQTTGGLTTSGSERLIELRKP
jgi:SAM-dependent methyltransferase